MNEFEQDKKIRPNQLDIESVIQPELFFKWAEKSVEAKEDHDLAILRFETIEAQLDIEVRNEPEKFNVVKITVDSVRSAVRTSPKYLAAKQEVFAAAKTASLLSKAVVAMEHKKRMIENLTKLHGQEYFAGPHVPRDLVAEYTDYQTRKDKSLNERMASKVRKRKKRSKDEND